MGSGLFGVPATPERLQPMLADGYAMDALDERCALAKPKVY